MVQDHRGAGAAHLSAAQPAGTATAGRRRALAARVGHGDLRLHVLRERVDMFHEGPCGVHTGGAQTPPRAEFLYVRREHAPDLDHRRAILD